MKGKQMEGGKMKKVKQKGMESRKIGGQSKTFSHTVNETGGKGEGKAPAHPDPSPLGQLAPFPNSCPISMEARPFPGGPEPDPPAPASQFLVHRPHHGAGFWAALLQEVNTRDS